MYILKDGRTADNMKEGCELLNISSERFRRKVKSGEIKKSDSIKMSKGENYGRTK